MLATYIAHLFSFGPLCPRSSPRNGLSQKWLPQLPPLWPKRLTRRTGSVSRLTDCWRLLQKQPTSHQLNRHFHCRPSWAWHHAAICDTLDCQPSAHPMRKTLAPCPLPHFSPTLPKNVEGNRFFFSCRGDLHTMCTQDPTLDWGTGRRQLFWCFANHRRPQPKSCPPCRCSQSFSLQLSSKQSCSTDLGLLLS